MKRRSMDLTGQRFGRLVVLYKDEPPEDKHDTRWMCLCDCGAKKIVTTGHLTAGSVRSCGCIRKEQAIERFIKASKDKTKHGETKSRLYSIWHGIKQRCENAKIQAYKYYGGKGVKMCPEWRDYEGFAKWAYANGYYDQGKVSRNETLSIDRIDSNGDYCPENCQWITVYENTQKMLKERWENAKNRGANRRSGADHVV